jgi:hypothetical protein
MFELLTNLILFHMLCPMESRVDQFLDLRVTLVYEVFGYTQNSLAEFYIWCILRLGFLMGSLKLTNSILSLKVDLYYVEHSSWPYNSLKSLFATPKIF